MHQMAGLLAYQICWLNFDDKLLLLEVLDDEQSCQHRDEIMLLSSAMSGDATSYRHITARSVP